MPGKTAFFHGTGCRSCSKSPMTSGADERVLVVGRRSPLCEDDDDGAEEG